jgi:hypothetical protein
MRKMVLNAKNPMYYVGRVTYTLVSYTKTGIVVDVTIENGNTDQIFFWSSWRRFKRYVA